MKDTNIIDLTAAQPAESAEPEYPGRYGPIGKPDIQKAAQILQEYKRGKASLESRIVDNEQWFKMRHADAGSGSAGTPDPNPASAWLFNSIANKHADAMDSFPEPNVLPREAGDADDARQLTHILPVVLEQNDFEQTYSDVWWYKLKNGTGVYGVFWNGAKENGLGDIEIAQLDILNVFWQPGIKDIQKSRNLFIVDLADNDLLEERYPFLQNRLGTPGVDIAQYMRDDMTDTSDKSAVVDWYYRKNGVLHYCKFVGDELLYASENDPAYADEGWYSHGRYPVVFDPLFIEEGSPAGFGYIDVMKNCQSYIDRLNGAIMKNALMASKIRYFIREDGAVNEQEFANWERDFIHVAGGSVNDDSIRQVTTSPLPGIYLGLLNSKIEELKETSGNRDFSQGGVTGGVTAASAIAALQEAGGKLTRDMVKSAYRAYTKIMYLCIELIRQFYDEPRQFRILGTSGAEGDGDRPGQSAFVSFDNRRMKAAGQGDDFGVEMGSRQPIFDIKIVPQKQAPFSKIAQNELAKELYGMGFFRPEMADQAMTVLDIMSFDGKEAVKEKVAANATMGRKIEEMGQQLMMAQQQMQQMAAMRQPGPGGGPIGGPPMGLGPGGPGPAGPPADSRDAVIRAAGMSGM